LELAFHASGKDRPCPDIIAGRETTRDHQTLIGQEIPFFACITVNPQELLEMYEFGARAKSLESVKRLLLAVRAFDPKHRDLDIVFPHGFA
jgi:hypothetical protein